MIRHIRYYGDILTLVTCDDGYIYVYSIKPDFNFSFGINENDFWYFSKRIDADLRESLKKYIMQKPLF